jgi:hypothetical protein
MATFLVPDLVKPLATDDLIAACARQLKKRQEDLSTIHDCILKSCFASAQQFEWQHAHTIRDFDFKPSALVLIHNLGVEMDKTKPRYFGPMLVI